MRITNYPYPEAIHRVICSDLDETFLPFKKEDKHRSGIPVLEKFLLENIEQQSLIFGFITGSSLNSFLRKTEGYITYYPHFIASGMGTELYWFKDGELRESESWIENIRKTGYRKENAPKVLRHLADQGVELVWQAADYQGKCKDTFYYSIGENLQADLALLEKVAADYGMKALYSRCNPGAGDPENCYDVDLMPKCCGKGEVMDFIRGELSLSSDDFYCFGDSFNDFSMFARAKHAYLVKNADPEAKKKHPWVLDNEYCHGIVEKLGELLFED